MHSYVCLLTVSDRLTIVTDCSELVNELVCQFVAAVCSEFKSNKFAVYVLTGLKNI